MCNNSLSCLHTFRAPLCELEFIPMLTDEAGRAMMKAKPGYAEKLAALMKKMGK